MIKQILLLFLLLGISLTSFSQGAKEVLPVKKNPYGKNYKKPQFICVDRYSYSLAGGHYVYQNINDYLLRNTSYPDSARKAGIEGEVIVRFMVDEKGAISDIKILKGIGGGCDQEAIRVIKSMCNWKPATYNHKPTKAIICQPIAFKLLQ